MLYVAQIIVFELWYVKDILWQYKSLRPGCFSVLKEIERVLSLN